MYVLVHMHVYLLIGAIAMCFLQSVNCVRYNADATVLLSGSYDKTIRAWDLRYVSWHGRLFILAPAGLT